MFNALCTPTEAALFASVQEKLLDDIVKMCREYLACDLYGTFNG